MQAVERQSKINPPATKKITPEKFARLAFFAALALFLLVNLALLKTDWAQEKRRPSEILAQAKQEHLSGTGSSHSWSWWLSRLYQEQTQAPDVVVFGSSLLGSAHASIDAWCVMHYVDVLTHRRMLFLESEVCKRIGHKVSIFSLGSPGEMASDFYVISKALFVPGKKPKLVIATIAPRDFIDSTMPFPAATDHYKFFSNYLDLTNQNKFAYPDFFSRLGAELDRLPLKRLGKLSLTKHAEDTQTYWTAADSARIEPGKAVVPPVGIPPQIDNSREYRQRFRTPQGPNYACEMHFFKQWLADMKKQGISVTVICMPTTKSNRQLLSEKFWLRFRADVSAACSASAADWMDLSDCKLFQPNDYLDTVHMNGCGAARLFPVIAERITTVPASRRILSVPEKTGR